MNAFPAIGTYRERIHGENSFWPSFTDVMMVITLIFLMATSLLVVRNWHLVAELQESIKAEQLAAQMIETTSQENATLEERLANAEQSNSILRLRLLKRDEELAQAQQSIREQESAISGLQLQLGDAQSALEKSEAQLASANLEIDSLNFQFQQFQQQIALQQLEIEQTTQQLRNTEQQLGQQSEQVAEQQQTIQQLTQTSRLQQQEIESYNQQLLSLKGDYETVKAKYEELIKPARSAKGKLIAEVYYKKLGDEDNIRFKRPDGDFQAMTYSAMESELDLLKERHGQDLYVKIIIPEDSGLTYNEAWTFMRELLVKYDYYYQE